MGEMPGVRGPMLYYWKKREEEEVETLTTKNSGYERNADKSSRDGHREGRGGKHVALETLEGERDCAEKSRISKPYRGDHTL